MVGLSKLLVEFDSFRSSVQSADLAAFDRIMAKSGCQPPHEGMSDSIILIALYAAFMPAICHFLL